jgi:hypothetical protein
LRLTPGAGGRRREALQLLAYELEQLRFHLATSRRRLNDLRNLRLIVEGEPSWIASGKKDSRGAPDASALLHGIVDA